MPTPFFMAIEGTDKSGKTTVATRLMQRLLDRGMAVSLVEEPGSTKIGSEIRRTIKEIYHLQALTEVFLFEAAKHEMTETRVKPALERGTSVITIRYTASTVAYQGYAGGADLETIDRLNQLATGGLEPDVTVIIDVPILEARRRGPAGEDSFESRTNAFYEQVREGYLTLARDRPDKHRIVDGTQDQDAVLRAVEDIAMEAAGQ